MFSKRTLVSETGEVKNHNQKYPYRLNFYNIPPIEEITTEEFEVFALDRLQVLKAIESASLRSKTELQVADHIRDISNQYLPLHSTEGAKNYPLEEERRKDHISHFILRLAYCRTEELRKWFIKQECALFRIRFIEENKEERQAFLNNERLYWNDLTQNEKESMKNELSQANPHIKFNDETFFIVNFEQVPDLVARRAVYIKAGKAYVPISEQVTLVVVEFRKRLSAALDLASRAFPSIDDERILPLLNNINQQYLGKAYVFNNDTIVDKVTADNVDQMVGHFPLCMMHMHRKLRELHHLKHYARMQYSLFLKGIGLTVEEALIFWRKSFSSITDEKFQKEYAYNIRHNYGMEGKRQDYLPLNCNSIIMHKQPGPGEQHGCPFKHFSEDNLKVFLTQTGVKKDEHLKAILDIVKGKHYQVACTKYFEITKCLEDSISRGDGERHLMETITHPNSYFKQSVTLSKINNSQNSK
ncbi:DNA primase large subunit Spp2 [Gigaspora margarita]|uniref:DNA primase large subunit n=1 Tax=Gigaspora margarita TaxID=4874 RepID=A0A8H4ADT7_GIGMA|nr:DNA primase large subunit Spp2 [Gigaspora margarita]